MEAVLPMDNRLDERLGFPGPSGMPEGPLDFGRCREVAVAGFRSRSADAGSGSQSRDPDLAEDSALESPGVGAAPGPSRVGPAQRARALRVHASDDTALSPRRRPGGVPRHMRGCASSDDPRGSCEARGRELGLVHGGLGEGGGGGGGSPRQRGSPRQGRARELGMATDGPQRDFSPSGQGRARDSRRAESTPHMHLAQKDVGPTIGLALCAPGGRRGAAEGAAAGSAQDGEEVVARGASLAGGVAGSAKSAFRSNSYGPGVETSSHPPPPPLASSGGSLPLSARRGAMVPELNTGCPGELAARAGQDGDEGPTLKLLSGVHRALARAEQRSPSRHNFPPGLPRSRNASPWRLPQQPSPGKASPGRAFSGHGGPGTPSPLSCAAQSSSAVPGAASLSPGGAGVSPLCPDTVRAQPGGNSGSDSGVPAKLKPGLSKSGVLSASSSPVCSPHRRRLVAASGGVSSGAGISLSAFQLDLIATAAASAGGTVPGFSASAGKGASGGGAAAVCDAQGSAHKCSLISGEPDAAAVASGSVGGLAHDAVRSNTQLSKLRGACAGGGHGGSRSRFSPASESSDRLAQAVTNSQPGVQLAWTGAGVGLGTAGVQVPLRRAQNAQVLDSAAFAAKRAAIRRGVRDQQQAQRQRVHRRGASFAGEPGQSLDLGLVDGARLVWPALADPATDARDVVAGGMLEAPLPADSPGAGQPGKPVLSPLSKFRHSWGNEPDFFRCTPWLPEDPPGLRKGEETVELMADYSIKRGQDLAQMLQGPSGSPQECNKDAASSKDAPMGARRHQPRHSMDLGKQFCLVEDGEGATGPAGGGADERKGSLRRAAKDPSSLLGGVPSHGPLGPLSLGSMGSMGLSPQDHILGQPYDDVTCVYAMHRKDLGAGQFGVVRKCKEIASGVVFACKSIRKECIRCAEDADDIRKEVACMRLLEKHPRFVSLHRAFEDKEHVHLVMDLCSGGDLLDNITENGPLPEPRAAEMCRMLVEALLHCHCLGIAHRDVKPENILLTSTGPGSDMKLVDFGVSTFFKPGEALTEIIGTPEYMAPEMLKQSYSSEADIWSAGVVLYVALTSVPPFWASDRQSLTESILNKEVRFKASRWAGISPECKDLVFRMLVKDPAKRIKATDVLRHPWIVKNCRF